MNWTAFPPINWQDSNRGRSRNEAYTIDKKILKRRRGEVGMERRREIASKIQQGLAIAGL